MLPAFKRVSFFRALPDGQVAGLPVFEQTVTFLELEIVRFSLSFRHVNWLFV